MSFFRIRLGKKDADIAKFLKRIPEGERSERVKAAIRSAISEGDSDDQIRKDLRELLDRLRGGDEGS